MLILVLLAETIAEHTKRPLYYLTTGELDLTDVTNMEEQLQRAFRLGWRWGAVVLIDEADVIMSKRTTMELQRNAIVAGTIVLRRPQISRLTD